MAMNPGMKMMLMQRTSNGGTRTSEYGGGRRMIGYDRDSNGQSNMRNEGGSMAFGSPIGYPYMAAGEDRGLANNYGPVEGPRTNTPRNEEVYRMNRGYGSQGGTEARRQRDSRGRYMMGSRMEDDDEETEMRGQTWYPPYGRSESPSMHGGSSYGFGDVYAHINAPGAMNRPMQGGSHGGMDKPVDEHTAHKWVEGMDGGEKFKAQHADQLRTSICPDCDKWEFYVAINAMYSDYHKTAREMGVDKPEYYAMLARDFLCDADAGPHKLRKYMENIPK